MRGTSLDEPTISRVLTGVGPHHAIASATGVPRRTVSRIIARFRANPDAFGPTVRRLVEDTDAATLDTLRDIQRAALAAMRRRVDDPRTKAGELAAIFREVRDETSLREGRATARTETTSTISTEERWALIDAEAYRREMATALLQATDEDAEAFAAEAADPKLEAFILQVRQQALESVGRGDA